VASPPTGPGAWRRRGPTSKARSSGFQPARRRAHVLRYGQDPELVVRLRLAHTLWLLGHDREADREHALALAAAEESTHPYSRAVVSVWGAILALDRGEMAELRRHVESLRDDVREDAPGQVRLAAEQFAGYLDVLDGRGKPALGRMRRVQEQLMAGPFAPGQPGTATRILLEGYAVAGEAEAGLTLSDQALRMGRGAELWEAEIRRLRATFLAAVGATAAEVEGELERALAAAERQGTRAFEERIRGTLAERPPRHHRSLE